MEILAFGIVKDIFGGSAIELSLTDGVTTNELKNILEQQYPKLKQLASYLVAVNNEYAGNERMINTGDEIAIIPPVSGG